MSETVPVWSDLMGGAIKTCYLSQSDSAIAEVGTIVVFNFTGYTIDNEGGISGDWTNGTTDGSKAISGKYSGNSL